MTQQLRSVGSPGPELTRYSTCRLATAHGEFDLAVYRCRYGDDVEEHVVVSRGDLAGAEDVFVRIHSECFTAEVLGSLHCDCGQQLASALDEIARRGRGAVVYLRQEGRGIGLGNKVQAYHLQHSLKLDTVDANVVLGFAPDLRTFDVAGAILADLGVVSVRLHTNNGMKIAALEGHGFGVIRVPSRQEVNAHNADYLETKRRRMGHLPTPTEAHHAHPAT